MFSRKEEETGKERPLLSPRAPSHGRHRSRGPGAVVSLLSSEGLALLFSSGLKTVPWFPHLPGDRLLSMETQDRRPSPRGRLYLVSSQKEKVSPLCQEAEGPLLLLPSEHRRV